MANEADILLDRNKLKSALLRWRVAAIIVATLLALLAITKSTGENIFMREHIARISVNGIITEEKERDKILAEIANNEKIKAVIVDIDTPGGTLVGGETLFNSLREISQKKPVVAVMGTIATSAGYMIATAADRIIAHKGTLTGSIGVLIQTAEVTDLTQKIGVNVKILKAGEFKDKPSLFEKMTPEVEVYMQTVLNDAHELFKSIVKERRQLTEQEMAEVGSGKVFSGRQALQYRLVDEIGGEAQAVKWLENNKNIDSNLEIIDVNIEPELNTAESIFSTLVDKNNILPKSFFLQGLLSIWNNGIN